MVCLTLGGYWTVLLDSIVFLYKGKEDEGIQYLPSSIHHFSKHKYLSGKQNTQSIEPT